MHPSARWPTSSIRFSLAAIILLAVSRPRLRGRSARSWASVAGHGSSQRDAAGYVLLSRIVGEQTPGVDGLALSVTVAALITLPLAGHAFTAITSTDFAELALSAGLGVALAYTLEMQAIRRTSAKTVSVLFSLDPAVGALAGLIFLGQHLTAVSAIGLACVVGAGIGVSTDTPSHPSEHKPSP